MWEVVIGEALEGSVPSHAIVALGPSPGHHQLARWCTGTGRPSIRRPIWRAARPAVSTSPGSRPPAGTFTRATKRLGPDPPRERARDPAAPRARARALAASGPASAACYRCHTVSEKGNGLAAVAGWGVQADSA